MAAKEGQIVYESGKYTARLAARGYLDVYKENGVAAVKCAHIGYSGGEGMRRARAEIQRRQEADQTKSLGSHEMQTIHQFIETHGVTITCRRVQSNPHMTDSRDMRHWSCTLHVPGGARRVITFSQGSAHTEEPTAADVLSCMASDASSARNANGWEDFARDMGMETEIEDPNTGRMKPNPEAKRLYSACLKEGTQLESLFGRAGADELINETEPL